MHIINFTRNLFLVDFTCKPVMHKLEPSVIVAEAYLKKTLHMSVSLKLSTCIYSSMRYIVRDLHDVLLLVHSSFMDKENVRMRKYMIIYSSLALL